MNTRAVVVLASGLHGKNVIIDERIVYTAGMNCSSNRARVEEIHRIDNHIRSAIRREKQLPANLSRHFASPEIALQMPILGWHFTTEDTENTEDNKAIRRSL
jgi:hypothetical protein